MKSLLKLLMLGLVLLACEDRTELTEPSKPNTGTANFTKFVAIGNSLTAGYQSSALYESAQEYSFSKQIANQVGVEFVQPTISDPGIGGRIEVKSIVPFSTKTASINAGSPTNLNFNGIYNNLGIPGALLPDILTAKNTSTAIDKSNVFFDIVLRNQDKTPLEMALSAQPTLVSLWIGNNDILGYATSGGIIPHTPVETFAYLYDQLCGALAQAGIPVILANIPNVSAIPFFTTVAPSIGQSLQAAQSQNPQIQGLVYSTSSTDIPVGLATIFDLLNNKTMVTLKGSGAAQFLGDTKGLYYSTNSITVPEGVNTAYPFGLTAENPFPNSLVLDPLEQIEVQNVVSSFNSSIKSISDKYNFHLVDINNFFNEVAADGYESDGVEFTTQYISGGIFSLDGVHPTSQGYAIIANQFIEKINADFGAKIEKINVSQVPGSLELAKKVTFEKFNLPIFEIGTFDNIFY
ncbi:MAG: hypothetical protein IPK06_06575 [Ignavibacteriae bacterium]|nr:hypothetical protein [Ignavibacteriota bacterium]